MAELINAAGTGSKEKFFEALKESLSGFNDFENNKNILPVAYDILAEKLAEVDRVWSATKNDNYLSIPVVDEVVIRSEFAQDRLANENAFVVDRIGNTSSKELFAEAQRISQGATFIYLSNVPSDPTNIKITNLNSSAAMSSQVSVLFFDAPTNSIRVQPIVVSGLYKIEYTTTGNVFYKSEEKVFGVAPNPKVTLVSRNLIFGSEKIFPPGGASLVRDIDYVVNYPDGVIDFFADIENQTLTIQYYYQRDLLKDVLLFSHLPVRNEIAFPSIEDPYLFYTLHQPIQDVTRIQNLTTNETYNVLSANKNEIRISGNRPSWTVVDQLCIETSKNLDFVNERYKKEGDLTYPENVSMKNHPLVTLNSLTITTNAIRLAAANQIIVGKNSTAYRRVYESNYLTAGTTNVVLGFVPQNFVEVVLYEASDITKTNLIVPTTFNSTTLQLSFVVLNDSFLPDGDYIVRFDTLQWDIYCAKDVSTLSLTTGGVLLRNATKRLKENSDYTLVKESDKFRVTFTLQGAANISNGSSFYTLTKEIASFETTPYNLTNPGVNEVVVETPYPVSYTEFLKTEIVNFTLDPLDLIPLLKLERFRERGQSADIITNPIIRVFSSNGSVEYVSDVDFVIDYTNKTIKRIDGGILQPEQIVKVFYEDIEISMANFTYVSDIIQIDYEYGDNAVDHTPTIVDTPATHLEALRKGVTQLKLEKSPADYKQVKISNTLYPEIPAFFATNFDPVTFYLSFPSVPQDGTYLFEYTQRVQLFATGMPYYVSYRYGARRDRLQNYFAYLRNLDIGEVFRQDEVVLMSDQVTQQLLYNPLNFYDVKVYAKSDKTRTPITRVTDYDSVTNMVTFDPIKNAGRYIFEYYTFNRDVEQLRKGLVGLSKAMSQVPTVNAFVSLLKEYTVTTPEIENVSDKRFQIRKRIKTTEIVSPRQTYLPISNISNLPNSGTIILYGESNTETITYSFIAGKRLEGIPMIGYGAITSSHPIGTRVVIQNNELGSYTLNPLEAKEADSVNGIRAVKFVSSRFDAGMLCDSSLKGWVKYNTVNNVNINEGTLSFWTGTKYDGNDGNAHYYVDLASPHSHNKNRLSIYKSNKGYLQFEIRDALSRLMSVRVDVRREVTEEILWLEQGQTEVSLSQIPSYPVFTDDVETMIVKTPSGEKISADSWNQETKKLLIEAAPIAGYYFFSYVTGFVNFDETDHFIEATWKVHTNDGTAPRLRLYVDGVKHQQRLL